ncbi:ABC transporter transmembrane domain-containing protein [Promicromonospora sp. MS192]|uniref:ABC transporter transmembrane domain-containing protein n=1 Tax=Promicromonospora sp. MS192 TaxID=3412684 RepID=UPI003C2FC591
MKQFRKERRVKEIGRLGLLRGLTAPHLPLFIADMSVGIVFFLCAVIPGLALREFLNELPDQTTGWVIPLAPLLAYLGFKAAEAVGAASWMAVDTVFRFRIYNDVRIRLTERLLRRPGALPPPVATGDILSRYREDTVEVAEVLGKRGLQLVTSSVVTSTVTLAFLFSISLHITVLAVLPTLGIAVLAFGVSRRIKELQHRTRQTAGDVSAFLRDAFDGIETVKVNGSSHHFVERVRAINDRRRQAAVLNGFFSGVLTSSQAVVVLIGTALVMWISADEIDRGAFYVGDFAYFVYALGSFGTLVNAIGQFVSKYQRFSVTGERLREILPSKMLRDLVEQTPKPIAPAPTTEMLAIGSQGVGPGTEKAVLEVRDLCYRHPNGMPVVQDFNLTARAGELVVITGRAGAGKTTLLRAIQGTLPRSSGSVSVRGQTLPAGVAMAPPFMSLTPQTPHVFSDSLAANVLLGRPSSDLGHALVVSTLDLDVARMPGGADVEIGPRGHRLSGGQLHRLAAARMLAHPADVLIIDDLSASLDVHTEHRLLRNLRCAARESVLIVVSNRPTVIALADQIHDLSS